MDNANSIWILTDEFPQISLSEGVKGGNARSSDWGEETTVSSTKGVEAAVQVDAEKLEQEMSRFLSVVNKVFTRAEQQIQAKSGIQLDEIELSVEINGEGQVKLLGSGAKAGGKGGIKLTFRRQTNS